MHIEDTFKSFHTQTNTHSSRVEVYKGNKVFLQDTPAFLEFKLEIFYCCLWVMEFDLTINASLQMSCL